MTQRQEARALPAVELGPGWSALWLTVILALSVGAIDTGPESSAVAVWWPAAGASVALLVLSPPRRWVILVPAIVVITALGNLLGGRPGEVVPLFGIANGVEALVAAAVLTDGARHRARLETIPDVGRLLLASVVGATALGGLAAVAVRAVEGGDFWETVGSATSSHLAADLLIVAVVLLTIRQQERVRTGLSWWTAPGVEAWEAVVQLVATTGVVVIVFGVPWAPYAFLTYPFFVWAALRLTPLLAMLEVLVTFVITGVLSAAGLGPFGGLADTAGAPDAAAYLDAYGCVLGLVTLTLAISSRQAWSALRSATQERDFTASVLDTTRALLLVLDRDLRVVRANAAAQRAGGRPMEELLDRPPWETVLRRQDERSVRELVTSGHEELELDWVRPGPHPPGRVVWTAARVVGGGRAVLMTGIDVTSRREMERLLRTLLDATLGTAIVGVSSTGRLLFANAGFERMLGYTVAELVDRRHLVDLHDPDELGARAAELGVEPGFDALVAGLEPHGGPERRDWTWIRRDGTPLTVSLALNRMDGGPASPLGYVGVAEDVSDRRRTEQALQKALAHERQAVEELQEIGRMKSTFVASVSHELRTPLTSMMGFIHLLGSTRQDPLSERQQHLLSRVDRNGRRLLALVEDLLTLTRIEARSLELEGSAVDLRDVVRSGLELVEDALEPRRLRLVVPDHGPCPVWGDPEQLERVVVNLASNAVKYTPDGGEVCVECVADGSAGLLRVSDTGIGIPADDLDHVLEPFYRAAGAESAPGTGLGLAIVASVVEAHRGTVEVRSSPGRGTTVDVRIPVDAPTLAVTAGHQGVHE